MRDIPPSISPPSDRPLLVVSRYSHWRWTLLLESVCRRFRDEGMPILQVGECAAHEDGAGQLVVREEGIRRINLPVRVNWRRSPIGYVLAYRRFRERVTDIIKEHQPRAAIIENPELTPIMLGLSERFPDLPQIYWATELSCRRLHFPFRIAERRVAPRLAGLVMNHPARIDVWKKRVGYNPPALCIPNTLDRLKNGEVFKSKPLREMFRNLNPRVTTIMVYQGVVSEKQAILEILEALASVPEHIGFAFGRTVGNVTYLKRVHEAIRKLGLETRTLDPGWVPRERLAEMTASADFGIALIRARNDNTRYYASSKLYNYLQAGVPVIGSALPALSDIIEREKVGLTVDQDSPEQIAEAICRVADPDTRAAFRPRVREAFDERLSLDAYWEKSRPTLMSWIGEKPV